MAYKGTQGRIVSSFMHSKRLIRCMVKKLQGEDQGEHKLREIVRDISLETLWRCWRTYHCALLTSLWSLKAMLVVPRHLRLSPKTLIKCGCRRVLMHDHFLCPCILILPMFRVIGSCIMTCIIHFVLLLPVYSMFLLQFFFLYLFLLILLYLFSFECVQKFKNP